METNNGITPSHNEQIIKDYNTASSVAQSEIASLSSTQKGVYISFLGYLLVLMLLLAGIFYSLSKAKSDPAGAGGLGGGLALIIVFSLPVGAVIFLISFFQAVKAVLLAKRNHQKNHPINLVWLSFCIVLITTIIVWAITASIIRTAKDKRYCEKLPSGAFSTACPGSGN